MEVPIDTFPRGICVPDTREGVGSLSECFAFFVSFDNAVLYINQNGCRDESEFDTQVTAYVRFLGRSGVALLDDLSLALCDVAFCILRARSTVA